ncbi:MAG: type II/IV secretion system ATPase subunit [Halobacteriaceae archaeon]
MTDPREGKGGTGAATGGRVRAVVGRVTVSPPGGDIGHKVLSHRPRLSNDMATEEAGSEEDAGQLPPGESESDGAERADSDAASESEERDPRVAVGEYTWEDYKREYYYDEDGNPPTDAEDNVVPFDEAEALGYEEPTVDRIARGKDAAAMMSELEAGRTVKTLADLTDDDFEVLSIEPEDVEGFDENEFFTDVDGNTTIVNRYDLEKAVPMGKKPFFREIDRYWVNKPYAFVSLFHSRRENERKYFLVEPYRNEIEDDLRSFLTEKLRTAIKYASDETVVEGDESSRREVIERETRKLLDRYDLYDGPAEAQRSLLDRLLERVGRREGPDGEAASGELDGLPARPEPAVVAEDSQTLTQYQVEKLLYYLQRNFVGFERIDGIKHDINVEDISCDGYDSPVFVYHTDYEQLITNVTHGEDDLDDFVVKMAQRSGKGISKRQPQVDATLPDGSRAQLTLGREVSDHGTNYTIRQFKDVPFTPIDLINWRTFSLDEMALMWLCIENHKSLLFAGGTASGKTTSLNAVSLFIPSNTKIVSIEDTREVELPQRNWIASVTRPSFSDDDRGDIDEFDLLEAALRQRPDYIVMGEVRGEEGRTLFQVMSTGHTTLTTFHADSVGEVLKRFTTDPINVSKTLFTALDLVSIQAQTRVQGRKVRRNRVLTEINEYSAENDEINVQDVYEWLPEGDDFQRQPASTTLEEIQFDRGWQRQELEDELFKRRVVLAYLIDRGLNEYAQVAATLQAFINDPDTILTLAANDELGESLADLREMESVLIDIDPEKEEMVPRPDPTDRVQREVDEILAEAEERIFSQYRGEDADLESALQMTEEADDVVVDPTDPPELTAADLRELESNGSGVRDAFDGVLEAGDGIFEDRGGIFGSDDESESESGSEDAADGTAADAGPSEATGDRTDEADGADPTELFEDEPGDGDDDPATDDGAPVGSDSVGDDADDADATAGELESGDEEPREGR